MLNRFDIKQPVFFADLYWDSLASQFTEQKTKFYELSKQLPVFRDLSLIVPKRLNYEDIQKTIDNINLNKLQNVELFDIFESDKLGKEKKSLAISFSFLDEEKTLTDKEVDSMMSRIMSTLDKELQAEIRK
jgi:phenylalanyl-tRNA synthetase beta chain